MNSWLRFGGGNELLNDLLKNYNCIGVAAGNTGAQMGGWFRKELKSVDDIKGLKFRIGGFAGTIVSKLGVVPQQLAGGDIYPALEKGTLDACEWVGPYDDEKLGFQKVAKYYYYPGWWEGCGQGHNIINLAKWNELPKHYQAAIMTASGETWEWVLGKYDHGNPAALKRLIAGGAQLRAFPQDIMEASYKAANEIYAGLSQTNPHFKKLLRQRRGLPRRLLPVDAGGRAGIRLVHDAHAHPHIGLGTSHRRLRPRSVAPGLFLCATQFFGAEKSIGGGISGSGISILTLDGSTPVPLSSQ